ncbi:MAG: GNAT family N-acetyltransferase [Oscillospiraceae bacterium]|nr:GNAT family N-acetyltransferase [Oscillospiraceae bacterium]
MTKFWSEPFFHFFPDADRDFYYTLSDDGRLAAKYEDWQKDKMRISTERLHIRPFQQSDLHSLYQLLSDADVMQYLEPPFSEKRTAVFLDEAALCDNPLIYAVDDNNGNFVGYVIYHAYDEMAYEIGWVLGKEHWGKGYADELTQALIADAKDRTKSLVIECSPEQSATKKIALRNGFAYEGNVDGCEVYRRKI